MIKIPFTKPDITDAEIIKVSDVLRSGWITTGPITKQFEKEIASFCNTSKSACMNSQTMCAEMVLRMFGIGPGDEVIVPAYTYSASCSIIDHVGSKVVMIDCQKDHFEMDYEQLEGAITDKTKAIIPVDLAGIACDYEKIYRIIDSNKSRYKAKTPLQEQLGRVLLQADTAHSFGASRNNKMAGEIADFSCFSFHAVKNLTTGEGGAVTWRNDLRLDDDEIYRQFMLLSLHGQTKDALNKTKSGQWEYDIVAPYYKGNMTDVAAALGLSQLQRYDTMLARRKEIITKYDEAFLKYPVSTLPHYDETSTSSGHLYLMRINGIKERKRNEIIIRLEEAGIACNVHYKPLPMLTAYKNLGFDIADFPNAFAYYENEISLPIYSQMTDKECEYVITQVEAVLRSL